MEQSKPLRIMMIEDNPGDVRLVRESMAENKIANELIAIEDGESALKYLKQQGEYANAPRPDVILLDLNLPGMNGQQVLAAIKAEDSTRAIPVVILTSSAAEADILRTYELQASCYVVKPLDLDQFMTVVQSIEHFWLSIVRLPNR